MFKFKGFQVNDYARASLTDGLVLAHDTGCGKSLACITWPLLKVGVDWEASRAKRGLCPKGRVLVVAPEGLHQQMQAEWREKFGITATKLDSQDTYRELTKDGRLPNGWYLTSFTQLASNKVVAMPDPTGLELYEQATQPQLDELAQLMNFYRVTIDDPKAFNPPPVEDQPPPTLAQRALSVCQQRHEEFTAGLDEKKQGIRCIYSPRLSDLCHRDFECVVIDEANKIKGEETAVGIGCRIMDPKYRLVLTATPIKNRLPDIFWLIWWAAGGKDEAHARWPYSSQTGESEKFAVEFLTTERNLTKEHKASIEQGKPKSIEQLKRLKKRGKVTADVCNLHRLWKLIAPNILRRRKADIGEYLVPKIKTPVRVPMGELQAKTYAYHLAAPYVDKNDQPAVLSQLMALRSCAAAPHSPLLLPVPGTLLRDERGKIVNDPDQFSRSKSDYTPKVAAALNLIEQILARKEQVVVFSALHEPLDALSARLNEARIPHDVLDGRKTPSVRGAQAAEFKKGLPHGKPVLLAGVNAMAEGHSWHLCNNAILLAFDWAYNLFEQAINRVHRLNSARPVNIYPVISEGTIDRRLESLLDEKSDAAELVLDGCLIEDTIAEVNLSELLRIAHREFHALKTMPETQLEAEWLDLRDRLERAYFENCCGTAYYQPKSEPTIVQVDVDVQVEPGRPEPEPELERDPDPNLLGWLKSHGLVPGGFSLAKWKRLGFGDAFNINDGDGGHQPVTLAEVKRVLGFEDEDEEELVLAGAMASGPVEQAVRQVPQLLFAW